METELPHMESLTEMSDLRMRINLAEEALRAIRNNEIDALVVGSNGSERVRTLSGADLSYRTFVEKMRQGAATLSASKPTSDAIFSSLLRVSAFTCTIGKR